MNEFNRYELIVLSTLLGNRITALQVHIDTNPYEDFPNGEAGLYADTAYLCDLRNMAAKLDAQLETV